MKAIEKGIPFQIKMDDSQKHSVSSHCRIALGEATVIIVGKDDMPHMFPMVRVTGISYLKPKK